MKHAVRILDATARCLARHETLGCGGPILVAVSGGRDSTVLAWLLAELHATGRCPNEIQIAHVDHRVHDQSASAARLVAHLAERLELPFRQTRLDRWRENPSEQELRDARYSALARMATAADARLLLTAHHADDDLETVLFRMMRGTGPRGLAGIPESRRLDTHVTVARPLLGVRRADLHALLEELELPWFEDPTNRDPAYTRNRLRHQLIPELRATVGDHLDESLLTLGRQARKVTAILDAQGRRILGEQARFVTPHRCELDLGPERGRDVFLEEAICQIHERLHQSARRPRWSWARRVLDLRDADAGRRVQGHGGLLVERTRNGLLFLDLEGVGAPPEADLELPSTGGARFGSTEWEVQSTPHRDPPLSPSPGFPETNHGERVPGERAILDPRGAPRPWRLRTRRPGDRFWPLGSHGPVDLRRFMQNRRLPRFDRDRLPLLVDATDRVLWIPGVEICEPNRIQLDSGHCFELKLGIVGSDPGTLAPY